MVDYKIFQLMLGAFLIYQGLGLPKSEENVLSGDMKASEDDSKHFLDKRSHGSKKLSKSIEDWEDENDKLFGDLPKGDFKGGKPHLNKHSEKKANRGKKKNKQNKNKSKKNKNKGKNHKHKRSADMDFNENADDCEYKLDRPCGLVDVIFRRTDGSCNNLKRWVLGMAYTPFKRMLEPVYSGDFGQEPRQCKNGKDLPGARAVSKLLHTHTEPFKPAENHASHICMMWGQFSNHDISDTAMAKKWVGDHYEILPCNFDDCQGNEEDCFPIEVPADEESDSFKGKNCLPFTRAEGVAPLLCKDDDTDPREQLNTVTHFLDGSAVYGSEDLINADVIELNPKKSFRLTGALLKESIRPESHSSKIFLPDDPYHECGRKACSLAGDHRVDMVVGLTTLHTIWLREHNRVARELFKLNPGLNGQFLYHFTKRIISAEIQHITYNEYLPTIFGTPYEGTELLKTGFFEGYDSEVDPRISAVFAGAANRYGHSMVPSRHWRLKEDFSGLSHPFLFANETWFNPYLLYEDVKPANFINGMILQEAYKVDRHVTDKLTTKLFIEYDEKSVLPEYGDLASRNIQRGRDNGVAGYGAWRRFCGLEVPRDFTHFGEIIGDPEIAEKFKQLYGDCSVEDIDLFSAGLVEKPDPATGGLLGPTFRCLVGKGFADLRRGDRFWYENGGDFGFSEDELTEIRKVTLSRVLCDNSDGLDKFVKNAMKSIFDKGNEMQDCSNFPSMDLSKFAHPDINKLVKKAQQVYKTFFL